MNIVLTSYFTSKKDPQRDRYRQIENFRLMQDWWESLHEQDMEGIIFHDELSESFQEKYGSDQVAYEKVELGPRSTNDERFFVYQDWLNRHKNVDNILLTDLFDVEFHGNPFCLFSSDHKLYCGGEEGDTFESRWMQEKLETLRKHRPNLFFDYPYLNLLNPGLLGGERSVVLNVIEEMCKEMATLPEDFNSNFVIFNIVAREMFDDDEIMYNRPLNSAWKQYESSGEFYVRHK